MKQVSYEEFCKRNNTEYKCLEYICMTKPAKFFCKKHGEFVKTPKNFLLHHCNKCTNEKMHDLFVKKNFIEEAKRIFPEYDYSKVDYFNDETEIIVICKEHGEFKTTPNRLLSNHQCNKCADALRSEKKTYSIDELLERANKIHHNKYKYFNIKSGIFNSIDIECSLHGRFQMTWNNHINMHQGCPNCCSSYGEEQVFYFLENNKIEFIKSQTYEDLKDINKLSYDFYLPKYNLLIECQGPQHFKNTYNKPLHEWHRQLHHDWLKRKYAKDKNIKLLYINYKDYKIADKLLGEYINGL